MNGCGNKKNLLTYKKPLKKGDNKIRKYLIVSIGKKVIQTVTIKIKKRRKRKGIL